jgi:hypothetical protein
MKLLISINICIKDDSTKTSNTPIEREKFHMPYLKINIVLPQVLSHEVKYQVRYLVQTRPYFVTLDEQ